MSCNCEPVRFASLIRLRPYAERGKRKKKKEEREQESEELCARWEGRIIEDKKRKTRKVSVDDVSKYHRVTFLCALTTKTRN